MDTTSDLMLQLAGQDLTDYFPLYVAFHFDVDCTHCASDRSMQLARSSSSTLL